MLKTECVINTIFSGVFSTEAMAHPGAQNVGIYSTF